MHSIKQEYNRESLNKVNPHTHKNTFSQMKKIAKSSKDATLEQIQSNSIDTAIKFSHNVINTKKQILDNITRFSMINSITRKDKNAPHSTVDGEIGRKLKSNLSVYATPRRVYVNNNVPIVGLNRQAPDQVVQNTSSVLDPRSSFEGLVSFFQNSNVNSNEQIYVMSAYKCPDFIKKDEGSHFSSLDVKFRFSINGKGKGGKSFKINVIVLSKPYYLKNDLYYEFLMTDYKFFLPHYICYNLSKALKIYMTDLIRNPWGVPNLITVMSTALFSNIFIANALECVVKDEINCYAYLPPDVTYDWTKLGVSLNFSKFFLPISKMPLSLIHI